MAVYLSPQGEIQTLNYEPKPKPETSEHTVELFTELSISKDALETNESKVYLAKKAEAQNKVNGELSQKWFISEEKTSMCWMVGGCLVCGCFASSIAAPLTAFNPIVTNSAFAGGGILGGIAGRSVSKCVEYVFRKS